MTTAQTFNLAQQFNEARKWARAKLGALLLRPIARELLIVLAFCLFTAVLTWPYVARLQDAVAGPGDPYLLAWTLWWDYHQTFNDPLNLFHANVLYPYRYTLAFSEHCYGLALPFFPLFALGFRPLTVHAVAMFFGFVLSGYGAFRLARTLTGSYSAAWMAGIIFAFVPYRFNMMAQLVYLFSVWIPLLFEALVLFARSRSVKLAAWVGFAFFMTGLTSVSWLLLSLVPLALWAVILLTRLQLWRERAFWIRGGVAIAGASLALLPFLLPYYFVHRLYGFKRRIEDVKAHSAMPIHWLVAEGRNKLWAGMGANFTDAAKFQMFPGLLPVLLSLAEILVVPLRTERPAGKRDNSRSKWIPVLDAIIVVAFALSIITMGFEETQFFGRFFHHLKSERTWTLLSLALIARLCLAYPNILRRGGNVNLIQTLRSPQRSDAFWLGLLLTVIGFWYSLGWNFFFYRFLYDVMPGFKSMRAPMRGAVFAYLGLALLAGLGAVRLGEIIRRRFPRIRPQTVYVVLGALLLIEFNAAPLHFMRGDVYPDAVTLRLKETPMRGGIAALPANIDVNQRYMLRAADHGKPLIVGTSGFTPPYLDQIEKMTRAGTISPQLMDLLEKIPASYLLVANHLIAPERRTDFSAFLAGAVASGRLRFINRFDGSNDLYAVTAIEQQAQSEAALPPELKIRDWSSLVEIDPVELVAKQAWTQTLYRMHVATFGVLPRYEDFIRDVKIIGRGVLPGSENQERQFQQNLRAFADDWTLRPPFTKLYDPLDHAQRIDRFIANAGISLEPRQREELIERLTGNQETLAGVLLKLVNDPRFIAPEQHRSLVVLHYFAYLRRNPDDPPDNNLSGMNFWIEDLKRNQHERKLATAFAESFEHQKLKAQH